MSDKFDYGPGDLVPEQTTTGVGVAEGQDDPGPTGAIEFFDGEYGFLSNFFPSPVAYAGEVYQTAEHAFQAAKTGREEDRLWVAGQGTPGRAKRAGRNIRLREDWEKVKDQVMLDVVRAKFMDPNLAVMLLRTGDRALVEGNTWHDSYWGVCVCGRCGQGRNQLGKALEQVRKEIRGDVPMVR